MAEFYVNNCQVCSRKDVMLQVTEMDVHTYNVLCDLPQSCLLQLHALVVDKLVRMQIVDSMAVISWLFTPEVMPQFTR